MKAPQIGPLKDKRQKKVSKVLMCVIVLFRHNKEDITQRLYPLQGCLLIFWPNSVNLVRDDGVCYQRPGLIVSTIFST